VIVALMLTSTPTLTAFPCTTLFRSGSNIQPWQVIVLTGQALKDFGDQLTAHSLSGAPAEWEYAYYPRHWREPYLARRRKVGWDRSEEHTSELQSRENLVCRLLLVKK